MLFNGVNTWNSPTLFFSAVQKAYCIHVNKASDNEIAIPLVLKPATLRYVSGNYLPSYLLINFAETQEPLDNVNLFDEREKRIFFHEYTHFLQDITGGYGHGKIWNNYDRTRQMISQLQQANEPEIPIALNNATTEHERLLGDVRTNIEGSYFVAGNIDDNSAKVSGMTFYRSSSFETLKPGSKMDFINLMLEDERGQTANYAFGELAISETMAYLMEIKFFGEGKVVHFPYRACQRLGAYLGTSFTENKEWLFALCDTALLFDYPGFAFYMLLVKAAQQEYSPEKAEDIYCYGIAIMDDLGFHMQVSFQKNKNGAIEVVRKLFSDGIFKDTVDWFVYILEKGYAYRVNDISFMLKLYQEALVMEGSWNEVYLALGV